MARARDGPLQLLATLLAALLAAMALLANLERSVSHLRPSSGASDLGRVIISAPPERESFHEDRFEIYRCEEFMHERPGSLPDFLVAGVHKGGSTALFGYLTKHGHVRPASCKETHFFSKSKLFSKGIGFYRRHFFNLRATPHVLTGEGTPNYVRNPHATARIAAALPHVKTIVSLRDPVERFVSQYVGFVERKLTRKSCREYWRQEAVSLRLCAARYLPERAKTLPTTLGVGALEALRRAQAGQDLRELRGEARPCDKDDRDCVRRYCLSTLHENAIARSVYADQLTRWLRFFPPEAVHLVQAERLYADTEVVMQEVAAFLGLREFRQEELRSFKAARSGSKHHLSPLAATCDREAMRAFFAPENAMLYDLLAAQWPEASSRWQRWPGPAT